MKRQAIEKRLRTYKDEILDKQDRLFDFEGLHSEMENSLHNLEDEEKDQILKQMADLKKEISKLLNRIVHLNDLVYKFELELYNLDVELNKEKVDWQVEEVLNGRT